MFALSCQAKKVKDFEKLQRKQEKALEEKPAPKPRGRPRRYGTPAPSKPVVEQVKEAEAGKPDEQGKEAEEGKPEPVKFGLKPVVDASKLLMYPYGCIIPNDTAFDCWDGFQGEPDSDMEQACSSVVHRIRRARM